MAVLIAVAVKRSGEREVVGVDVGPAEDLEFWRAFLRQLVSRGLHGVRLVTSDSHLGLKRAVAEVLVGATWQRCRVHFMRNALSTVPKVAQQMVAATLRTIFAQPDLASAKAGSAGSSTSATQSWLRCSRRRRTTSWPTLASPSSTGARSGRPTPWSDSTKRSPGAVMWSASSLTASLCYA